MAKAPKKNENLTAGINTGLLAAIGSAVAAGGKHYLTKDEGLPLLNHIPPLIDVDTTDIHGDKASVKLTPAGQAMVNGTMSNPAAADTTAQASPYAIISGAILPKAKRGGKGGGAPTVYPFANLEVGQSFFVPVSEKHPDPVKSMGSTISAANLRYAQQTGTKTVTRAKRGPKNKLVLENGQKVMETKDVPEYTYTRKFSIRRVEAGKEYGGGWIAPANGGLVQRIK